MENASKQPHPVPFHHLAMYSQFSTPNAILCDKEDVSCLDEVFAETTGKNTASMSFLRLLRALGALRSSAEDAKASLFSFVSTG